MRSTPFARIRSIAPHYACVLILVYQGGDHLKGLTTLAGPLLKLRIDLVGEFNCLAHKASVR